MQAVEDVLNKLIDLRRELRDGSFARELIEENEQAIVEKNQNQLSQGLDSQGREIEPEYAPLTKVKKRQKGQPDDRVTFFDRGDFYKGIEVDVFSEKFELIGTDPKTPKLIARSGSDILGLTVQSTEEVVDETLRPAAIIKVRERLDLVTI